MQFNPRRVFHVDDDPQFTKFLAGLLHNYGFEVISLNDSTRAQAELMENDCRVVILDIEMPNLNGMQLLDRIKKQDGAIQVIMLTGLVSMNTVLESMRHGAEACHFKPVKHPELLLGTLNETFNKLDRLWYSLKELKARRHAQDHLPLVSA